MFTPRPHQSSILLETARSLLLVGVVAAPWPYAGVPQWAQPWFAGWLLGVFALWLAARFWHEDKPALSPLLLWPAGLLAVQGGLLISNAQTRFEWETFRFIPVQPWWPGTWAPGALDTVEALPALLRIAGVLAGLIMMADMARTRTWRRRLFYTLLGGGLAVAVYGLAQRISHSPLGLWTESERDHTYFAAFYYHGNAGAFINLLVPGLALLTMEKRNGWSAGALFVALAASVATASKAALLLTLLLLVLSLLPVIKGRRRPSLLLFGLAALLLGVLPLCSERVRARWAQLPSLLQWHNPRLLAWRAELRMLPDAGPWGIGPANFKFAFPHYTHGLDSAINGFWEYAHQDYLQTLIEWGWCGFLLWAVLIGGALRPGRGLTHRAALLTVIGLLLHALGDYPLQIPAIQLYAAGWLGILWSERGLRLPALGDETVPHLQH